jgi:hypothetical protein
MTIKELKDLLDQYDENMTVRVFDSGSGNIDITEVYKSEGVRHGALQGMPHKVEYICIV